jgi:serine/threonine-protein kinase RsbW
MAASDSTARSVSLTIPAKPDYVVLARLALSAVCRLTPLAPEQAADLKLAITEAATYIMGGDRRMNSREDGDSAGNITFTFELGDDSLGLGVTGEELPSVSDEERELSLALIRATVDSYDYSGGTMRLTKQLDYSAE